jgi:hypothetical protein
MSSSALSHGYVPIVEEDDIGGSSSCEHLLVPGSVPPTVMDLKDSVLGGTGVDAGVGGPFNEPLLGARTW